MRFTRIDKVGVEMEGGWDVAPAGLGHDGSVRVVANHQGEMRSSPFASWEEVKTWVTDNHPVHTHQTCGIHVHVSVKKPGDYARLMDSKFQDFFVQWMTLWGKRACIKNRNFWDRLDGKNTFCKKKWHADLQSHLTGKCTWRYAHWNYCFEIRGTAECRMLPTFKSKAISLAAIGQILNCVENWLAGSPTAVELATTIEAD